MESVAIIGGGQMGQGIAQACLQVGCKVFLYDSNKDALKNARLAVEKSLFKFSQKQDKPLAQLLDQFFSVEDLTQLPECDLLIEAAPENMQIKASIFQSLPAFKETILTTNTSSLNIARLSALTHSPERFMGLHFMNPVVHMQLVEIITHPGTTKSALEKVQVFVGRLNKSYIISADRPGFVVNRILIPMIHEAMKVLSEGVATASDIDQAMRLGSNHPIGPLALADLIGLDTCVFILNVLHTELKNDHYAPCSLLKEYVDKGWLGRKTKRGFYQYD